MPIDAHVWLHACLSKIGCDDVVGPEGMEKFCEDIGVEPENVSRFLFCIFGSSLHKSCIYMVSVFMAYSLFDCHSSQASHFDTILAPW